jgi:DNA-binding transcriptional MerR regulator
MHRDNTVMKNGAETFWTIDELGERVALALGGPGYEGVPSGRVRDVPDLRTIRYYTTLGLLDRPAAMRGRTALYGPRHVLQLVAIKRLQAQGLSLAAVQERVVGLSDAALKRLTAAEPAATTAEISSKPSTSESRAESFWRIQPESEIEQATLESPSVQDVPLQAGLVLSIAAGRGLDEDDLRVIHMAAAPLIEILRLRGLIAAGPSQPTKGDAR